MYKYEYTEKILKTYPDARSDDNALIYLHLKAHGLELSVEQYKKLQEICNKTVSLYDLVRSRQKLQSPSDKHYKEEYEGNPEVMAIRKKRGEIRRKKEREEKYNVVQPTRIKQWYTDSLGNRELI